MSEIIGINTPQLYKPSKPVVDMKYRRIVKSMGCCIPGCKRWYIEFAHTGGRGLSQLADDRNGIPLCKWHHQTGEHSYHNIGRRRFEIYWKINIAAIIVQCRVYYDQQLGGQCA